MDLLARREYPLFTLQQKLQNRFDNASNDISDVLQQLIKDKLQCDDRYTGMFVRFSMSKGRGPLRIRQELSQKKIKDHLIKAHLHFDEGVWLSLAKEVYDKKFGDKQVDSAKEKAKCMRYMQYRGFSSQHYMYLMNT